MDVGGDAGAGGDAGGDAGAGTEEGEEGGAELVVVIRLSITHPKAKRAALLRVRKLLPETEEAVQQDEVGDRVGVGVGDGLSASGTPSESAVRFLVISRKATCHPNVNPHPNPIPIPNPNPAGRTPMRCRATWNRIRKHTPIWIPGVQAMPRWQRTRLICGTCNSSGGASRNSLGAPCLFSWQSTSG